MHQALRAHGLGLTCFSGLLVAVPWHAHIAVWVWILLLVALGLRKQAPWLLGFDGLSVDRQPVPVMPSTVLPAAHPVSATLTPALWWAAWAATLGCGIDLAWGLWHADGLRIFRQDGKLAAMWWMLWALSRVVRADGSTARPCMPQLLPLGLVGLCLSALAVAWLWPRAQLPSGAVPWATGIALAVAVLAPWVIDQWQDRGTRLLQVLGTFGLACGLAAVVLSRSRAAWIIVPWLGLLLVLRSRHRFRMAGTLTVIALALGSVGLAYDARQPVQVERGLRLLDLWTELQQVAAPQRATSTGSRLLMWEMALDTLRDHPWTGVGPEERVRRVQSVVPPEAQRDVAPLVHVHQQFLNQAMDYGLPGLLAALLSLAALAIAAATNPAGRLRQQLAGVCVVHGVGLCFNANMTHGPYVFTMAALVAAAVLQSLHDPS